MPLNKSALLRYRVIDSCLTNRNNKYPTLQFIITKIEEALDGSISDSMLNKDLAAMKEIYDAPIHYDRYHKGYCYTEADFSIKTFSVSLIGVLGTASSFIDSTLVSQAGLAFDQPSTYLYVSNNLTKK